MSDPKRPRTYLVYRAGAMSRIRWSRLVGAMTTFAQGGSGCRIFSGRTQEEADAKRDRYERGRNDALDQSTRKVGVISLTPAIDIGDYAPSGLVHTFVS